MAKPVRKTYSAAEKSALVAEVERLYRGGGRTYTSIAHELGLGDSTYHSWVGQGVKPTAAPVVETPAVPGVYTDADRARLVSEVERLRADGQAIEPACRLAGISVKSYRKWRPEGVSALAMRPVEVTALVPIAASAMSFVPSRPPAITPALALVAPGGYRIEGLSIEAAAQLLRALAC